MTNRPVSKCIYAIKMQREYRLVNVSRFVIACPRGVTTGGPEALHQLAKEVSDLGFAPLLWDPDESRGALESASAYEGYGPTWTDLPPTLDDIVVLPEVFGDLIPRFYSSCQIIFWWLSVDNFFAADRISINVLNVLFPDLIHCYQSEYARKFLKDIGINEALPLSDYLNEEFVKIATTGNCSSLKTSYSLIAVNPAKGFERTSNGLQGINENRIIRLEHMSRAEVIESLGKADIYLDLGSHPGTDRLPREAALMNCVVVTNTRGSAGNQIDIPIDKDIFKINDEAENFHVGLQLTLEIIRVNPTKYLAMQTSYRAKILKGKDLFVAEVSHLVQEVTIRKSNLGDQIGRTEKVLIEHVAKSIKERDSLIQERDSLIQERDSLIQERNAIIKNFFDVRNSLSWKITSPLRLISSRSKFLRRH